MAENQSNEQQINQEASVQTAALPFEIAVLPLQSTTLFPGTVVPLAAGRARSVAAVEAALQTEEKLLACVSVRPDKGTEEEATPPAELYEVGTLVMIKRMFRGPDAIQIIVQGTERVRVLEWTQTDPFMRARVQILPALVTIDVQETEALQRNVRSLIERVLALLPQVPPEVRAAVLGANDPVMVAYFLASVLDLGVDQEQLMLEADTVDELLRLAHARLAREVEIMQLRSKIATEAQGEMDKAQRDYILRQQLKAIQKELGPTGGSEMATKKAQSKAGIPAQRRGQQMGDERSNNSPHKMDDSKPQTPALRGRRPKANAYFADDSQQAIGGAAAHPRSNSPSVAAVVPTNEKVGESGGEAGAKAKRKQAKGSQ